MSNSRQKVPLPQTPSTEPTINRRLLRAVRIIAVLCPLAAAPLIAITVSASLRGPCGQIHPIAMVVGGIFAVLFTLPYLHLVLRLRPSVPGKEKGLALAMVVGLLGFVIAVLSWASLESAQRWLDLIWALTQCGLAVVAFTAYRLVRSAMRPELRHRWAFGTAAGWAMGWVMWVVICLVALIAVAAIVLTNLLKSCPGGVSRQANAIGDLQMINRAEATYSVTYAKKFGFSRSLAALGGLEEQSNLATAKQNGEFDPGLASNGSQGCPNPTSEIACLVDAKFAEGTKEGYRFTYAPHQSKDGVIDSYSITASPISGAGHQSYSIDQGGAIRVSDESLSTSPGKRLPEVERWSQPRIPLLLKRINSAEAKYASVYSKGFSPVLEDLGGEQGCGKPTEIAACLIDTKLAFGEDNFFPGYRFVYSPGPKVKGVIRTYSVTASSEKHPYGNYYYTDQTGVIRTNKNQPATAADMPAADPTAILFLNNLHRAEDAYAELFAETFSPSLAALGPLPAPNAKAAGLIDPELGSGEKMCTVMRFNWGAKAASRYRFTYRPVRQPQTGKIIHFTVIARPIEYNGDDSVSYFINDSSNLRWTTEDREATADDASPLAYTGSDLENGAYVDGALKLIVYANKRYYDIFKEFSPSLAALARSPANPAILSRRGDYIDPELARGEKQCLVLLQHPFKAVGYRFSYTPEASGTGKTTGYTLVARPLKYGGEYTASFFSDQSDIIRVTTEDREPTAADAAVDPTKFPSMGRDQQPSPLDALRSIKNAEKAYSSTYITGFSPSLADLDGRAGPAGTGTADAAGLIDRELATGQRTLTAEGVVYQYTYVPGPPDAGRIRHYAVIARPLKYVPDKTASYFMDETGVIRRTFKDRDATSNDRRIDSPDGFIFKLRASDGAVLASYPLPNCDNGCELAFDGANIWAAQWMHQSITRLRASDGVNLGTFSPGSYPSEMASDSTNIWVVSGTNNNNFVWKFRASDGTKLGTFTVGKGPAGIAFDGASMWVTNYSDGTVTKLRATDGATLGTFPTGRAPWSVAFDGLNIWVVNAEGNSVSELRATDGAALRTISVDSEPRGIVFDGANIWVANRESGSVSKLRVSDGAKLGSFSVPRPYELAFDGSNIWVASFDANIVTKLRASDGAKLGTFSPSSSPKGILFDGANIWVGGQEPTH